MGRFNVKQQKQLQEIKKWAEENGNQISYLVLQDLLKYENQPITEDEAVINQMIHELMEQGIRIEPLDGGENYQAQSAEQDGFVPASVNIAPITQNVSNLMERLSNEEIDLNPVFQRRKDLWDNVRQSRLIESLMLRIPIPSFYFDMVNEGEWKVIDGLQRLTAFSNYLIGEEKETEDGRRLLVKRKFEGLQYLKDFNGKTFDELPRQYIRRIKEAQVTVFGVQKGTPENVVYNIFQRINTGGLALEPQEIRNAMYHGAATELAKELAEGEEFLEATMYAVKPDRMADQEYVIRFMAFTILDYKTDYKDDIDAFLILAMKTVNAYNDDDDIRLKRIVQNFSKVMRYSKSIFGKNAFRKIGDGERRRPINKALFELFSVCFSELEKGQLDKIVAKRELFLSEYAKLFQEKEFLSALRSGKRTDCIKRIDRGRQLIKEFI